jgi:hypothetical protein
MLLPCPAWLSRELTRSLKALERSPGEVGQQVALYVIPPRGAGEQQQGEQGLAISFPGFCGLVTDVRSLEAIVGFRFIARSKARQCSTIEAIGPRPSLLSRRLLKQSPRDRPGFRKRQERCGITWALHAANAHGQSIHAIFEQRGRLKISGSRRRHAASIGTPYAIFTFLMISNLIALRDRFNVPALHVRDSQSASRTRTRGSTTSRLRSGS